MHFRDLEVSVDGEPAPVGAGWRSALIDAAIVTFQQISGRVENHGTGIGVGGGAVGGEVAGQVRPLRAGCQSGIAPEHARGKGAGTARDATIRLSIARDIHQIGVDRVGGKRAVISLPRGIGAYHYIVLPDGRGIHGNPSGALVSRVVHVNGFAPGIDNRNEDGTAVGAHRCNRVDGRTREIGDAARDAGPRRSRVRALVNAGRQINRVEHFGVRRVALQGGECTGGGQPGRPGRESRTTIGAAEKSTGSRVALVCGGHDDGTARSDCTEVETGEVVGAQSGPIGSAVRGVKHAGTGPAILCGIAPTADPHHQGIIALIFQVECDATDGK